MALNKGFNIGNEGKHLFLQKGSFTLFFNKLFQAGSSHICGIELFPITPDYAAPAMDKDLNLKLQTAHKKLGHCGEDSTRSTANYYGWKTSGGFKPCEDCSIAKAKQQDSI